jgi:hypothetical protein
MASKKVITEAAQVDTLIAHGDRQQGVVDAALKALGLELNAPITADVAAVIVQLAALTKAAAGRATGADVVLTGTRQQAATPIDDRDASADVLHTLLLRSKSKAVAYFGSKQAAESFGPRVPLVADAGLGQYARTVAELLPKRKQDWKPLDDAEGTLDLDAMAKRIADANAAHDAAVTRAKHQKGAATDDMHTRDAARVVMHNTHQGFQLVLEGVLRMAGLHDAADSLVVHHHAHPEAASTDPSQPNGTPKV